jgi:ERCC4-type nuclease
LVVKSSNLSSGNETLVSALVSGLLTTALIVVTSKYVVDTGNILKQSKNDQRIRHLERSLELFYIPLIDIIDNDINEWENFKKIGYYRYLAEDDVSNTYEIYVGTKCDEGTKKTDYKNILETLKTNIENITEKDLEQLFKKYTVTEYYSTTWDKNKTAKDDLIKFAKRDIANYRNELKELTKR